MEYDSRTREKSNSNTQSKSGVNIPGDSDISEPPRIRRRILFRDAVDRVLLDYNVNILPWLGLLLWIIFLAAKKG